MKPTGFKEANCVFGPPEGFEESQVVPIHAYQAQLAGGSCDGAPVVITAWLPSDDELAELNAGAPVYLTFLGGLPAHMATTSFKQARGPG